MPKKSNLTSYGGKREGAGRKKSLPQGAKITSIIMTPEERLLVIEYLKELRSVEK